MDLLLVFGHLTDSIFLYAAVMLFSRSLSLFLRLSIPAESRFYFIRWAKISRWNKAKQRRFSQCICYEVVYVINNC